MLGQNGKQFRRQRRLVSSGCMAPIADRSRIQAYCPRYPGVDGGRGIPLDRRRDLLQEIVIRQHRHVFAQSRISLVREIDQCRAAAIGIIQFTQCPRKSQRPQRVDHRRKIGLKIGFASSNGILESRIIARAENRHKHRDGLIRRTRKTGTAQSAESACGRPFVGSSRRRHLVLINSCRPAVRVGMRRPTRRGILNADGDLRISRRAGGGEPPRQTEFHEPRFGRSSV